MSIISLLPLLAFVTACSAVSNEIKPMFFPDYFTGLETQEITTFENVVLDYDLTSVDNKNVHFSSCTQVESVQDGDIAMSEYHLLTMLRLNCEALKKYIHAGLSDKTYLDDVLIKKDISKLPATAYPYVSDYDRSARAGKKLGEYYKKFVTGIANDGAIEVVTDVDSLLYQVIATGDFNDDRFEDALIRIDWHVIKAFGKGSKLVLITKRSTEHDYEEISLN